MTEPWYAYLIFAVALAGQVLAVRKSRWCWPVWMVSNAGAAIYLASRGLWTQGALQVVFFAAGAWGWRRWSKA
jgi:nicotinamide riboside transporter PnuC